MQSWFKTKLFKLILWLSNKFSSKPERERVFRQLSDLYNCIHKGKKKKGIIIPFNLSDRFIIFSDQHMGSGNGADDFMLARPNYLTALDHYFKNNFNCISLGDSEELWENSLNSVKKQHVEVFEKEKQFIAASKFFKIYGNHDLFWSNDPLAYLQIKSIYGIDVPVYEGVVLQTTIDNHQLDIFCTHGHQGDKVSDGNWFSKFFVSKVWAPIQAFTKVNPNTPAYNAQLKTLHNSMMYDWSSQHNNLLLVTGHTHQPVFESLTHVERLYRKLLVATRDKNESDTASITEEIKKLRFEYENVSQDYLKLKPTYFNAGCCCYNDGDITGIEIDEGCIRLVKWTMKTNVSERLVLEERPIKELIDSTR